MTELKRFLHEKGLTQAEFARRLKYSPVGVSLVLSGKRPPSNGLKLHFIEAFGLDAYRTVFHDPEPVSQAAVA